MRLNWFEHILPTDPGKVAQNIMGYKPVGYEDVESPRRFWEDFFETKWVIRYTLKKDKIKMVVRIIYVCRVFI